MNAVRQLENMGLSLILDQGNWFILGGLKSLPVESRRQAVAFAKEHKPAILEELRKRADEPTPTQLAHARRMLVDCPSTGGKLHCWHCSRCPEAARCSAWHGHRNDVTFFRQSEKPASLFLAEESEHDQAEAIVTTDYAALCPSYWRGCFICPEYRADSLRFCGRYSRVHEGLTEVVQ
ncbi:hypothetical protein LJC59_08385 [Desulfovibrio sp. OttesenSCG-928-A18]|nr:hypothetical protein [Desulfovibrio sp. OttesenSCG-928-A18]